MNVSADVRRRRPWLPSFAVGGLWLIVVLLSAAVSLTPFSRVQQAVLPSGVTPYIWSWAMPWPVLSPIAGAVAVTVVHAVILRAARPRAPFAATWLATVAAGAIAGMTVDVVLVFGSLVTDGWAMWGHDLGSRAAVGAYWGLLYGWIPALLARRLALSEQPGVAAPRGVPVIAAVVAVAGLLLLGAVQVLGNEATQAQLIAGEAAVEPAPVDGAARPDAGAAGEPVPERIEGAGVTGDDGCTPERAMVLIGDVDGATGHRGLRLELMNFSDVSCVIEGYPDIAFGDQNDHLLDVTIERGSSFMATDPGPTRVEIPAGGSAVAFIGWDANSTHGALVARTLWASVTPGETRGSKPIESDIVAGSSVEMTAWSPPTVACPTIEGVEQPPECAPYDPDEAMAANDRYRERMELDQDAAAANEQAMVPAADALEVVRASGDITVESVREALERAGLTDPQVREDYSRVLFGASGPAGGCIHGEVAAHAVTIDVGGYILDGGCLPAQ